MQELEKIMEVIDNRVHFYDNADEPMMYVKTVKDIIRKRMNDGWIPVGERLPEEAGTYIVNALNGERSIVTFAKWKNRYKCFDMTGARAYWRVNAWRPLPEPYRPERSNNHDRE